MFDSRWYLEVYPDVADAGLDPILHYVRHGANEGRNPSDSFETSFYLDQNPDVVSAGMNAFWHYLEFGHKENRAARMVVRGGGQSGRPRGASFEWSGLPATKAIAESGVFDRDYYLNNYPTVVGNGGDPLVHYVVHGAREGKNPNSWFNTKFYLNQNPDVKASGMNPLAHFCAFGYPEFRDPSADLDMAWHWIMCAANNNENTTLLSDVLSRRSAEPSECRAAGEVSAEDKKHAVELCMRAISHEEIDAATAAKFGNALARLGCWEAAERAYDAGLRADWHNPEVHARLAIALHRQGKRWQSVESWLAATRLSPDAPADWWFQLGEGQEQMNRFADSVQAYQHALSGRPNNASWQYRLGFVAEKAGQAEVSAAAYSEAIRLDKRLESSSFGIGVFHQSRGYWPEAADAYEDELRKQPLNAGLHYRLGMAHDRCYRWEEARTAYSAAISLDPKSKPYWHYRYGFVLERMKRWTEAAAAYAAGVELSTKAHPYWRYRQGYVLALAGCHEQACEAYIDMRPKLLQNPSLDSYIGAFDPTTLLREALKVDSTRADLHYKLGKFLERKGGWEGAAEAYRNALARSNLHQPEWFYSLGYVLYQSERHEEACKAFQQTRIIQRAYGISEDKLKRGSNMLRWSTHYAEYMETLPINDKAIFYDSHLGKFASCTPLALFKYLSVHPIYKDYLHVWAIDDPSRVPPEIQKMANVAFVQRHTDLFLRYLASAKYLISNSILPQYFTRRPEQRCLATWHGTPLKTLGKQQQYKFQEHKRTQRFFLQSTHIISPNPHTTDILLDSYDLRNVMTGKLAQTGYPRIDLTLNANEDKRRKLRSLLGLTGERPIVLYAPTWRGTLETVSYEAGRAKSDLMYLAKHHDCDLLFRGHHLMESILGDDDDVGCPVVPPNIDTNELLSIVDVLITDYSSIFFDFLVTGKPVLYYVYDQSEYESDRGLYFSMDEMPGYKSRDIESLSAHLGEGLLGRVADAEHLAEARQRFNCHDDGRATERVVDFLFHDDETHVVNKPVPPRVNLLMHGGGFKRNGITTSFLNLLKYIDKSKVHVTVAISPEGIESDVECLELFERVPGDVGVVARHGLMAITWEERWLRANYEKSRYEFNEEQMSIIRNLFNREFQRIFGTAHFDIAVSFSGYDSLWGSILNLQSRNIRKIIYMHNDMREEYSHRFPELMRMFRLYRSADWLVGVCEESTTVNRERLAAWLDIEPTRFVTSENVQDPDRIVALSAESVEGRDEHLFGGEHVFINMGRLSVEKAQDKLIRSFTKVFQERGPMKLLILGVGPLREYLQSLIEELGMTDHIHLLGLRSNPYPYVKRAGCFVLSSNHEAKCMSLIEALILGVPCVATDISGNRDIKKDFPEYFFENSEGGLRDGMLSYLAGNLPIPKFDAERYQKEALQQFEARVLDLPVTLPPIDLQIR